jgi:transcriptional regulator with XRE-family HTH domain
MNSNNDGASINTELLESKMILKGHKTRKSFAEALGVSQRTISNVLNGIHTPRQQLMNSIYKELDLTPEEGIAIFFANDLRNKKVSENKLKK